MITFYPMTLLVSIPDLASVVMRPRRPRLWLVALALAAPVARPTVAGAQVTLSHTEDAAPIPRGMLRIRVSNAWTRYDQRFCDAGRICELGAEFATPALGAAQLPRLTPLEMGLQTLTSNSAVRLTLGRLDVRSAARIVTTPIAVEYGVSRRLSLGIMVPVVQTRRVIVLDVNQNAAAPANVDLVRRALRRNAASANAAVAANFQRAADSLGALIARCASNPAGPNCAAVTANGADAAAAQAQALAFANAARAFGIDSASVQLAPRKSSLLADSIEVNRARLNARLQQYLGAGAGSPTSLFLSADSAFSYIDLQGRNGVGGLLRSGLGGGFDSLATTDRLGIGDIEIGAQFLVFDRFQRDSLPVRGVQTRLAVGASVRLATSRADTATNLADIGLGNGAGVELRSAFDLIRGRAGGTIAGRYVKSFARPVSAALFGDPEAPFPYPVLGQRQRQAGDVLALDVTPRYLLTETLALDGHYGVEHAGAATFSDGGIFADPLCPSCAAPTSSVSTAARTAQRLGLGLRYSTVDAFARGSAPYPVEISFTHLETVSGSPGVLKVSRDQIQMRLFFRLFGK